MGGVIRCSTFLSPPNLDPFRHHGRFDFFFQEERRAAIFRSMKNEKTPDAILKLGTAFMGSKVLLSAVELGLFTELAKGPRDKDALRVYMGLHERSVADFLDALV